METTKTGRALRSELPPVVLKLVEQKDQLWILYKEAGTEEQRKTLASIINSIEMLISIKLDLGNGDKRKYVRRVD